MYMLYHRCEVYISFIHTEPDGEVSEYKCDIYTERGWYNLFIQ